MNRVDTAAVAGSVLEKHFALVPPEKYRYPEVRRQFEQYIRHLDFL